MVAVIAFVADERAADWFGGFALYPFSIYNVVYHVFTARYACARANVVNIQVVIRQVGM